MFCQQAIHTAPHSIRVHWFQCTIYAHRYSFGIHGLHWNRNSNPIHNLRWNWKLMNVQQQQQHQETMKQPTVQTNERTTNKRTQDEPAIHPSQTCITENEQTTNPFACQMKSIRSDWNASFRRFEIQTYHLVNYLLRNTPKCFRKWFTNSQRCHNFLFSDVLMHNVNWWRQKQQQRWWRRWRWLWWILLKCH